MDECSPGVMLLPSTQIKSNHFYCHITATAHVPWRVKFLRVCSRQCINNLHIDSTYLQLYITYIYSTLLIQKTMCRIHIHILSTHSVLFKTYLQLSIHVMHRMYTFYIMYTYIHKIVCEKRCNRLYIARICNVMDVRWMVSSGSR